MNRSIRTALLLTPAVVAALLAPTTALAAKYTAEGADPAGDGPVPGRDITDLKVSYRTSGSLIVVVTLAGPIDAANADAAVSVSLGSSCKTIIGLGGGLFSDTTTAGFAGVKGKKLGKREEGEAKIVSNVYELKFKNKAFKDWKPGCIAVGLVDPNTVNAAKPTIFDATDEIKIKK